jgi:hypothetical protein
MCVDSPARLQARSHPCERRVNSVTHHHTKNKDDRKLARGQALVIKPTRTDYYLRIGSCYVSTYECVQGCAGMCRDVRLWRLTDT